MVLKFIGKEEVVVEPHNTLNSSKGIIFHRDLAGIEPSEITKELSMQLQVGPSFVRTNKDPHCCDYNIELGQECNFC